MYSSLTTMSQALQQHHVSSYDVTRHYLNQIKQHHNLNAFIQLDENLALSAATNADNARINQQSTPLTGIPIAHKDIFCTKDFLTTCGSRMLANYRSPFDATIVKRLRDSGTVLLGKTNMDEFAMGSSNETSYFGAVKNPWHLNHVAGGSSGGSAAAVAAGLVPFATGSDTGGSVRQPAAFCGISGLKPTYGLISRWGMIAYASSLDQAGLMAKSVEDIAFVLNRMVGEDEQDSTSIAYDAPNYQHALKQPLDSLRIGVPRSLENASVDPAIQASLQQAIHVMQQCGASIHEVDLTLEPLWVPCYYVIACAEASSNLARYDGVRYGYQTDHAQTLHELIMRSRSEGFGLEVKRRILTGTHVLAAGYYEAYYLQAQKIRRLIRDELQTVFNTVDLLLGPTTPTLAFELGNIPKDPVQRYLADMFTVGANLAGLPALSIPAGFEKGLPIGIQLMGPHFSESRLLQLAHHFQQHTDWHQRVPPIRDENT